MGFCRFVAGELLLSAPRLNGGTASDMGDTISDLAVEGVGILIAEGRFEGSTKPDKLVVTVKRSV
jgi:hypothetical protein